MYRFKVGAKVFFPIEDPTASVEWLVHAILIYRLIRVIVEEMIDPGILGVAVNAYHNAIHCRSGAQVTDPALLRIILLLVSAPIAFLVKARAAL
jgi:hypothetical protein